MARNLTNLQLEIITSRIMKNLRDSKITKEVQENVEKKVKTEYNYKTVKLILDKYNKSQKDLQQATNEMNEARHRIKEALQDMNLYSISNQTVEAWFNKKIELETNKLIPTPHEIQSDIVLMSIQGSTDIINDILKKY